MNEHLTREYSNRPRYLDDGSEMINVRAALSAPPTGAAVFKHLIKIMFTTAIIYWFIRPFTAVLFH